MLISAGDLIDLGFQHNSVVSKKFYVNKLKNKFVHLKNFYFFFLPNILSGSCFITLVNLIRNILTSEHTCINAWGDKSYNKGIPFAHLECCATNLRVAHFNCDSYLCFGRVTPRSCLSAAHPRCYLSKALTYR